MEGSCLEPSGEIENWVLELGPRAKGQLRRGTSPSERLLNWRSRHWYVRLRHQRATANGSEEVRTREGLKIRFGEISWGRRSHPGNDRSGHLEPRCNWRRRGTVNLLLWRRGRAPGSRPWQSETTDRDRGRLRRSFWLGSSSSSCLPQERRKTWAGLVCSRQILETHPSGNFVQGRKAPTSLEGNDRAALFRLCSRFREPKFDLFGPRVRGYTFLLQMLIHLQGGNETRRGEGVVKNRRRLGGRLRFVSGGWARWFRHFEQEARTAFHCTDGQRGTRMRDDEASNAHCLLL